MSSGAIGGLGETYPEWKLQQRIDHLQKAEAERHMTAKAADRAQMAAGAAMPMAATEAYGARAAIRELMEWHAGEQERLSVLLHSLPGILPPAADRALSDLVRRGKR